jgi:hypothetical protein
MVHHLFVDFMLSNFYICNKLVKYEYFYYKTLCLT